MDEATAALSHRLGAAIASATEELHNGVAQAWTESSSTLQSESVLPTLLAAGKTLIWDIAYEEPIHGADAKTWQEYDYRLSKTLEAVLCLFELATREGSLVIADAGLQLLPLIEDTIDLTSSRSWHTLFAFIQSRRKRLTRGMLPNRGKALTLLRTLNTLLRLLPRIDSSSPSAPSDVELRARIHLFMADTYAITDQSGTNQRGDYASLGRTWSNVTPGVEASPEENVDMESSAEKKAAADETIFKAIAGLQRYFAQPGLLAVKQGDEDSETNMSDFKSKSDTVLARMFEETQRGVAVPSAINSDATIAAAELVEFQLADPAYRRRLLSQFLIFLQTLQQLNPEDKRHPRIAQFPPTFSISVEDLQWAKSTFVSIRDEFSRMDENGDTFDRLLGRVVGNDRHHAIWKSLGAYTFEQEPMDTAWLDAAEKQAQTTLLSPAKPYQWSAGTRALTEMAKDPLKNVSQLRNAGLEVTLDQLKQEYDEQEQQEAEDAQGKMRVDENDKTPALLPPQVENKASLSWRALRLVMSDHLPVFEHVPKGDLPKLYAVMNGLESPQGPTNGKAAAASPPSASASAADVKMAPVEQRAGKSDGAQSAAAGSQAMKVD